MVAIRRLTPSSAPEDVDAAAQLLTTAFADDQLTRIVSGPVPGLHAARMRSTLVTGALDLVVFAAYDSDDEGGQMLGVLILKPPGVVDRHRCVSVKPTPLLYALRVLTGAVRTRKDPTISPSSDCWLVPAAKSCTRTMPACAGTCMRSRRRRSAA